MKNWHKTDFTICRVQESTSKLGQGRDLCPIEVHKEEISHLYDLDTYYKEAYIINVYQVIKCASKGCQISYLWWYWCFYSFATSVLDSRTESASNNGISKKGQSNTGYCISRVRMWHSWKLFWSWKGHRYQTSEIGIWPFCYRKCRFPILRCDSPSNFFSFRSVIA